MNSLDLESSQMNDISSSSSEEERKPPRLPLSQLDSIKESYSSGSYSESGSSSSDSEKSPNKKQPNTKDNEKISKLTKGTKYNFS